MLGFSGIFSIFFICVHVMVDFGSSALSMMSNIGYESFFMDPRTALFIFCICLLNIFGSI